LIKYISGSEIGKNLIGGANAVNSSRVAELHRQL